MLHGPRISLRPVEDEDVETFYRARTDIKTRGPWVPMPRTSLQGYRADFGSHGWWSQDEGVFLIVDAADRILGNVAWEALKGTIPDVELGYGIFDRAEMGKGLATEAVDLLAGYLFDAYTMNRLLLCIYPDNVASRRVAEKCGFKKEATAREAWPLKGKWLDIDIYVLTRRESDARRATDAA
jgi:Acetyltransferases, including N-acetylases of ribosomal proteins